MFDKLLIEFSSQGQVFYSNFSKLFSIFTGSITDLLTTSGAPSWVVSIVDNTGLGDITLLSLMLGASVTLVLVISLANWFANLVS